MYYEQVSAVITRTAPLLQVWAILYCPVDDDDFAARFRIGSESVS